MLVQCLAGATKTVLVRAFAYLYLLRCSRFLRLCDGCGEELRLNALLQLGGGGIRHFLLLLCCGLSGLLRPQLNNEMVRERVL